MASLGCQLRHAAHRTSALSRLHLKVAQGQARRSYTTESVSAPKQQQQQQQQQHVVDTVAPADPEKYKPRDVTWSAHQRPKSQAISGPRFEQTNLAAQPSPLPAIDLIRREPIRMVTSRVAVCDGGGGALGHPKIFINLDKPGAHPCGTGIAGFASNVCQTSIIERIHTHTHLSSSLRPVLPPSDDPPAHLLS
ncbi:hypothetical protein PCANC_27228 [Puccinia coronata f. sp. avenae]|nr:hypothetical protein PCANC_27228 [Puccinia coronata f. sp. avenae]